MAKKPKLTKAEKAMRRALAKQQAEEAKKQERRDHLERELVLAQQSWKKLKRQFKEMLLKMQMPTIRHDIEVLWHSYDAALDRKDFVIEKLLEELEERDLLRQRCFAEHTSFLFQIIAVKEERAREEQRAYEREREDQLVQREEEVAKVAEERTAQRRRFSLLANAMAKHNEDEMIIMRSEYVLRLDDERDKMNDVRKLLKSTLANHVDDAWRLLRGALAAYEASMEERQKRLAGLAALEARSTAVLEREEQRMQQLKATEEQMRWRLSHEEPTHVLRGRIEEQRYFKLAYCALRQRLETDYKHDQQQLSRLTAASNETLEKLRLLVQKAQRLLILASHCRALETQEERIVVIPRSNQGLIPVGALAFAAALHTPLPRNAITQGAVANNDGDDKRENIAMHVAKDLLRLRSETSMASLTPTQVGAAEGESQLESEEDQTAAECIPHFWRRVARADARRADLLATMQALRFERTALRRALRCCLQDVTALHPREVDRRQCAEACYERNRSTKGPSNSRRRSVVEAAHVYKNLPCFANVRALGRVESHKSPPSKIRLT